MPRDRRRSRRSGGSSYNPAIYSSIHSNVYEAVSAFQGKMMGMKDTFKAGGVQAASAGGDIQKAVQELVEGIMTGVRSAIPQFNQDKD